MTKIRGFQKLTIADRPIVISEETFELMLDASPVGRITQLSAEDAGLLAPHFSDHPDTICLASSGVLLDAYNYGVFGPDQTLFALEWVRGPGESAFPERSNKDCKVNRYVFGVRKIDQTICGYDVTERFSNDFTAQVGDHHAVSSELFEKYGFGTKIDLHKAPNEHQ
jgi:hypothetical protein